MPALTRSGWTGLVRVSLLIIQGFVAVTAFAGGTALVVGSFSSDQSWVIVPPAEYLQGSPFDSYLVPGVLLAVLLGGLHLLAFLAVLRRWRWAHFISAAAGFDALIWIFVQMVFIPFSVLQAVYFVAGLAELGLVLVALGVLQPLPASTSRRARRVTGAASPELMAPDR